MAHLLSPSTRQARVNPPASQSASGPDWGLPHPRPRPEADSENQAKICMLVGRQSMSDEYTLILE